jgi:hypothetical protein
MSTQTISLQSDRVKPSCNEMRLAYEKAKSVHVAGRQFGVCGQTFLNWMNEAGIKIRHARWQTDEIEALRKYYTECNPKDFCLRVIASSLGRPRIGVALKASRLGLGNHSRPDGVVRRKRKDPQRILPWSRWTKYEHPRGNLGKKHAPDFIASQRRKAKERWERDKLLGTGNMTEHNRDRRSKAMTARNMAWLAEGKSVYSRCAGGRRPDLENRFFRSSWEANYARHLNLCIRMGLIERWEYEVDTFEFVNIKRGVRHYTPDFKVWENGAFYYVEVKGWMDPKSLTKLKRMKKYHPAVEVRIVGAKEYAAIAKRNACLIPEWEHKPRRNNKAS